VEPDRPDPAAAGGPWWRQAVIYQIYPRSFCDAPAPRAGSAPPPPAGGAVGTLAGIRRRLDHIAGLGADAVWISPFYRSPMADYGYDVEDYCDVDPLFGTLADADELVRAAHDRGLRVLLDWVPNHTSDQHPWFVESRSSAASPKRDWYVWRQGRGRGRPPNNWRAAFGGRAWTYDEPSGEWYLHLFLPQQPDLNWSNPEVREAMHATLRFWLDRGVDGFRVDVVHGLAKDPELADLPPELEATPLSSLNDQPATHELVRGFRRVLDGYPGDRVLVGEVYLLSTAQVAAYYGEGDELHLAFNFVPLLAPWDAPAWRRCIDDVESVMGGRGAWPTWVLSNHDNPRHRSRYGSEARARAAAVLLLTLRGTPFLYAGEELGLEDADVSPQERRDPGGRDGCRAPIPWDPTPAHGWAAGGHLWLPWPPEPDGRNAETLSADGGSILHLYRRLLAARRRSPALSAGSFAWLPGAPEGVLAYLRHEGGDRRAVMVNFTPVPAAVAPAPDAVAPDGRWLVEVASDGEGEGDAWRGTLGPDRAVVLRPASR
jgi:alpha-glucosidase